jgi:zinc protease
MKFLKLCGTVLAICVSVCLPNAFANSITSPRGVTLTTSVEGITEYRLANGLKVLLAPDVSKPSIVVNITYLVGSRHENYGETGMAHLLEHMLFKGSKNHPKITEEFTQRGAQWNASTWTDRTNYYEVFTASEKYLDWALSLEADRMVNSTIRASDLASEMPVVRNEFEIGENSPVDIMTERIVSTMFLWHNYGKSTIGARSDIENVPVPRLQAFYREHYQPDNAVLLIGGQFDEAKTLAMVQKHFGKIPRPARKLQALYTQEPTQDGERSVRLERVGDVQAVGAGFHVPPMAHPEYAHTLLLTDVLANATSGRLHKALVETKKATSIASYNFENRDPSAMLVWAELRKEQSLAEAKQIFLKTVDGFAATPVTAEEAARAKSAQLKNFELTMNSSERLGLQLSEAIGAGDWRLFFLNRDQIRNATVADVQAAALKYLKSSNRTVGEFVPNAKPERAEVPMVADISASLKNFKGDKPIAQGEAFAATPENIEKRVKRGEITGGMKTALLQKKTRGETVSAHIVLRFGDETNLKGQRVTAQMLGQMLMRGTKTKTREQLRDEMDNLKANIVVTGTPTRAQATITATKQTLAASLKLATEMLRESTLAESEFELVRQEILAELERSLSDPAALAEEAVASHFNVYARNDVRYVPTIKDSIAETKAIKLEDVKKFYADFYGSNYGQLSIVGDFDEKTIEPLLPQALGNWKSANNFKKIISDFKTVTPKVIAIETPDKESATFIARLNVNMQEDDPDYAALKMADWMLGGGAGFSARLVARIRVKEGLSYAVGSGLDVSPIDRAGDWTAQAQYAPQNREKVISAFKDEMGKLIKEGFPALELDASKSGYAQSQQLARASDSQLAAMLASQLFLGRDMKWHAALDKKVEALKAADVLAAMQKHFNLDQMTVVNAGDFAKPAVVVKAQ